MAEQWSSDAYLLSVSTEFREQDFVAGDGQWTGSVPVCHANKNSLVGFCRTGCTDVLTRCR